MYEVHDAVTMADNNNQYYGMKVFIVNLCTISNIVNDKKSDQRQECHFACLGQRQRDY